MKIENVDFCTVEWSTLTPDPHPGETGAALWRMREAGNLRVRMVEYTPGYVAATWCDRGHVVLVLEGELVTTLKDGREIVLGPGASYQVGEGAAPHLTTSPQGAKVFIVD
jgi:quercetin dioxygenase-like cupin family protein